MELKILSGGQTGADRAALDWALIRGIPHGGWCPKGRLAEDGTIPGRYELEETPTSDFAQRTEWNVRDSDGTVIFSIASELTTGSKFTEEMAYSYRKPLLHLSKGNEKEAAQQLIEFLQKHGIRRLNVAGPRASQEPEVGMFVRNVLENAWQQFSQDQDSDSHH
jgi:hypothetical protein